MSEDRTYEPRVGSVYSVEYGESKTSEGIFRGYSAIGNETSVVMESEGRILLIPAGKITCMVLVEEAPEEKAVPKSDIYYG